MAIVRSHSAHLGRAQRRSGCCDRVLTCQVSSGIYWALLYASWDHCAYWIDAGSRRRCR